MCVSGMSMCLSVPVKLFVYVFVSMYVCLWCVCLFSSTVCLFICGVSGGVCLSVHRHTQT
jgi:uncharacterized membrane protein